MFVNISNHPLKNWSEAQIRAAEAWGELRDYPFPQVSPYAKEEEIAETADRIVREVMEMQPAAVMCQGEFTLSYALISRLRRQGVTVVAACSDRRVTEKMLPDGTTVKTAEFIFCGFREYRE